MWDAPNAYVVHMQWRSAEARANREMFQVVRVRDDKIVEIADYKSLGAATKTAQHFAEGDTN